MLAEAYYHDGKIEFTRKLHFRHTRFKLRVEVPDDEISDEATAMDHENSLGTTFSSDETYMQKMMRRLDEIRNMPLDESNISELTDKQHQRIAAFGVRRELRGE